MFRVVSDKYISNLQANVAPNRLFAAMAAHLPFAELQRLSYEVFTSMVPYSTAIPDPAKLTLPLQVSRIIVCCGLLCLPVRDDCEARDR